MTFSSPLMLRRCVAGASVIVPPGTSLGLVLDLLQAFSAKEITGLSLDDIAWYHRLRLAGSVAALRVRESGPYDGSTGGFSMTAAIPTAGPVDVWSKYLS